MKCEIINDLLPLYVDNVCSKETAFAVSEHLKNCEKCSKTFNEMSGNFPEKDFKLIDINNNLKEKDLLLNAKKDLRFDFMKKFLKKFYIGVIIFNILALILEYFLITHGYDLKYPRFFFGNLGIKTYIVLLFIFLLPLITSTVGILVINSMNFIKAYKAKTAVNVICLIISFLLSIISSFFIFAIPPLESITNSPDKYLEVESDMERYKNIYDQFFPESIPKDAENINYSYKKYNGLFQTTSTVTASWTLSNESYKKYKEFVQTNCTMKVLEDNKYEIYLKDIPVDNNYPLGLKLIFEYNDNKNELKYTAEIEV